jgi:heat shock protein HtpX
VVVAGFAIAYAVFSYFSGAKMALALSGAEPIAKSDAPELYRTVENLAIAAGLPTPAIYIIDDPAPNAFATGRDPSHAHVAVTRGLLTIMDDQELEGVIAHELSHVGNYDIRLMAVVLALVTVVSLISHFFMRVSFWGGDDNNNNNQFAMIVGLVAALVAPLVAMLLQLAVSRKREYLADASGALLTRYPEGLASALEKISTYSKPMQHASTATAHLFIASPLAGSKGLGGSIAGLFSTHPPIDERIARLEAMEQTV